MLQVDIYQDYVIIEGQRVNRPKAIARSDWMKLWEQNARGGFLG